MLCTVLMNKEMMSTAGCNQQHHDFRIIAVLNIVLTTWTLEIGACCSYFCRSNFGGLLQNFVFYLTQVVLNKALPRKTKVSFFGRHTLKCLAHLLVGSTGDAGLHEAVQQLVTDLATDSKLGICFKSTSFITDLER